MLNAVDDMGMPRYWNSIGPLNMSRQSTVQNDANKLLAPTHSEEEKKEEELQLYRQPSLITDLLNKTFFANSDLATPKTGPVIKDPKNDGGEAKQTTDPSINSTFKLENSSIKAGKS